MYKTILQCTYQNWYVCYNLFGVLLNYAKRKPGVRITYVPMGYGFLSVELTPWTRVLLEKLIVAQPFYGTR
jgi:hypothetical protein